MREDVVQQLLAEETGRQPFNRSLVDDTCCAYGDAPEESVAAHVDRARREAMPRAGAGGGAPYVAPPAPGVTHWQHATSREPRKLSPALDAPLLGRGPSPSTASQLLSPTARAATWSAAASRGRWRSRAAPTIAWTTSRLTLRARGPGRCQRRRSAPGRCQAGRAGRQGSGSRRRQVPLRRART